MDLTSDFHAYHERVTRSLVDIVKTGGQISNADLSFHRSNEKVSRSLDLQNARLLRLTNKLLKAATQDSNVKGPSLRDQEGVEDNWRGVVDVVDDLLEKADASLDEFTGIVNRLSPAHQDGAQTPTRQGSQSVTKPTFARPQFTTKIAHKPQTLFARSVSNLTPEPFKPLLVEKPHSIISLEESIGTGTQEYNHPYAAEIMQYSYPQHVYESAPPIPFTPPQQTSATFVDTEQGVQEMLEELKAAKEIAVDLEHHDYRSYYGIVCLMQISTRNKDWIVDTLKPWRENLQVLNQVFADPQIIKVFHGSSMDMIWLQRDLGLYVVGLFDTFYACEALQFPGRGLKYLLSRFANFEAQKQYQLADWRIRPLPAELIDYARSDTHYLLYIYDVLRNMLVEQSTPQQSLIDHVLQGSKKEATQVYTRFIYDKDSGRGANGWYNLFTDHANHFSPQQLAVFRALHEWRDTQAREEDEGVGFICANKVLWMLAESMPTNQTHLYGSGIRPIPPSVLKDTQKIFDIVRKAKQEALSDPPPHEFLRLNHEKYGIPNNRWKKFKEDKAKSQHTGVGATLQQLAQKGDVGSLPGTPKQLLDYVKPAEAVVHRADRSSLWGPVTAAMSGVSIETQAALAALHSVLPLPKLSADSFAQANGVDVTPPAKATAAFQASQQATPTPAAAKSVPDVFTLKQQSRKRKIDDVDPSPDTEDAAMLTPSAPLATSNYHLSDLTSPNSPDTPSSAVSLNPTPEMAAKKLAKQQRKSEKRARKAALEVEAAEKAANLIPFDYSTAPNLLNSPASAASTAYGNGQTPKKQKQDGVATGKGQSPGKVGIMNPFAKALDTGTGAKRNRMSKELQGRSRTFQS